MAAILPSQSCCCCHMGLPRQGTAIGEPSFPSLMSSRNLTQFKSYTRVLAASHKGFSVQVEMKDTKLPAELGSNGRSIKMMPTSEVMKNIRSSSVSNTGTVNSTKQVINGASKVVNGVYIIKRETASSLVERSKVCENEGLPPLDEPIVLQTDTGFSWANDSYTFLQRSIDVWSFVMSLYVRVNLENAKWAYIGGFNKEKQKKRRKITAAWMRERMLQLGPTFIKLGQLLSSRSDLFPLEYVDEMSKLQDRVPAFSPKKARGLIAEELGAPIDILFKVFEDQPLAAASLGQVHRAILHNGERVAIKVQRPGLKRLFDVDLRNLKLIAEYFQNGERLGSPIRDWVGVYEECAKVLYQEIDYVNEGKNADRFRRDFRNVKWVRVPLVHWDYTATKVLTLEYVPGVKINRLDKLDARGYSRSQIAARCTEAYLIQMLKTGFFHADPHPGNLAIDEDEAIIYYDFGMMGEIKTFTQKTLLDLFYAVYEKDTKKVVKSLINLGALKPMGDLSAVRRSVKFFLDNSLSQTIDQQQTMSAIGEDLFSIAQDQPFRFPTAFAFVIRAFSTLEGVGHALDPNFSFVKVAAPYTQELLDLKELRPTGAKFVQEIRKQAEDVRDSTLSMPHRVQQIEEFVKQLEAGDLKLRVRVLESERAAQKATILQIATMYTVMAGTLLNLGIALSSQGYQIVANSSYLGAGVFFTLLVQSMQRLRKLDKFEKMI